jgi:hypothetical protein
MLQSLSQETSAGLALVVQLYKDHSSKCLQTSEVLTKNLLQLLT